MGRFRFKDGVVQVLLSVFSAQYTVPVWYSSLSSCVGTRVRETKGAKEKDREGEGEGGLGLQGLGKKS